MAIQNDDTLVTKGDLKSLYADKIAPYLGGGISYYYTDRIGTELKCGDYNIQGNPTIPINTSQNTHLNLSARGDTHPSDFLIKDGNIVIPEGITVTIASNMVVNNNDNTSEANSLFMIYDYKNSANIGYASAVYHGNGVARTGSYTYNFTAPEGGAEIGIKCTYNAVASRKIGAESGLTITEIGRVVDPVKYVSNNSDLQETPVGNIISYMGNTVPKHYLACDGQTYSIGTYPELEAFIINEFGSINYFGGNGTTDWAVPDLRGEFLRGTGTTPYTDGGNGAAVGTHQAPTGINPGWTNNTTGGWSLPVAPSSTYSSIIVDNGDKYVNTGTRKSIIASTELKEKADTGSNAGYWTFRPTNTAVKYCIKYESTFHAFFSNAAYKVSIAANVPSHSGAAIAITLDNSDIIGDANLVSGNSFIAPLDGLYLIGMNWSNNGVWDQNYMINVNGADVYHVVGIGVTDMLQLQKGDVVTIKTSKTSAQSGRASFALVTSNYNPTIVSADSVYSENEQMIGYWKDGKPLYQRTLVYNNRVLGADINTDLNKNTINIIDYDFIHYANSTPTGDVVNKGGCHPQGASTWASWLYFVKSSDSNYWKVASRVGSSLGVSTCSFTITVRYTKTTDAASSLEIENSLLLNRPDLWTVGTEYSFGGGLYGQRFTGNLVDLAKGGNRTSVQLAPAGTFTNGRIFDFGGCVTAYNSNAATCVHPIGSKSINNSTDSSATGYHIHSGIYITGDGRLQLGYQAGDHYTTTANTYDVWVTYKK